MTIHGWVVLDLKRGAGGNPEAVSTVLPSREQAVEALTREVGEYPNKDLAIAAFECPSIKKRVEIRWEEAEWPPDG